MIQRQKGQQNLHLYVLCIPVFTVLNMFNDKNKNKNRNGIDLNASRPTRHVTEDNFCGRHHVRFSSDTEPRLMNPARFV